MSEDATNAAAEQELVTLRAEVARLRRALDQHQAQVRAEALAEPERRGLLEPDPRLPGLTGLWRGERGLGWRLFVQGVVAVQAVLAVAAGIAIVH
jgi:hypothetical protein